jgi:hypothetical protein
MTTAEPNNTIVVVPVSNTGFPRTAVFKVFITAKASINNIYITSSEDSSDPDFN